MSKEIKIFLISFFLFFNAGCGIVKKVSNKGPVCPKIMIADNTFKKVVFDGAGVDELNKIYSAEIMGYQAKCNYDEKTKNTELNLSVDFNVKKGIIDRISQVNFEYFVAILDFYPKEQGKKIFPVNIDFSNKPDELEVKDKNVKIIIPDVEGKVSKDFQVFLGLQLTSEELEYNRQNKIK